jgi:large subunit ribosomal protein L4
MVSLALRSALSDRCALGKVVVVSDWPMSSPSTKDAIALLGALGLRTDGTRPERVLVVLDRSEEAVWKSFRNLGERVQIILPDELNAYDVLVNDSIVFSQTTLTTLAARFGRVEVHVDIEIEIEAPIDSDGDGDEASTDGGAE